MRIFSFYFCFVLLCAISTASAQNIDSLYKVARSNGHIADRVNAWIELGDIHIDNPEQAMAFIDSAEVAAVKENSDKALISVYYRKGIILSNKAEFKTGADFFLKSLAMAEKMKDVQKMGANYNALAITNLDMGNYPVSLDYFIKALKIAEDLGYTDGVASTNLSMGAVYEEMKRSAEALKCYNHALELYRQIGDQPSVGVAYNNIGSVIAKTNPDSALNFFLKAEKILRDADDLMNLNLAIINIGGTYVKRGDYKTALPYLLEYMHISRISEDAESLAYGYVSLSDAFKIKKDYKTALMYTDSAIDLSNKIGSLKNLQAAYKSKYEAYDAMGDHQLALRFFARSIALKDSMINIESSKNINQLQTIYETEKKDKEIILKNAELEKQQVDASRKATQRNALIGGFVLVLALSGVTYRGYVNKQKANVALESAYCQIEEKNKIVEEKNKDILDSIKYAKRIQEAILPPDNVVKQLFPESFVMYRPKDIVCGDFYWFEERDGKKLFAAVDCTGHGVPGAFMSVVGYNLINQAVNENGLTTPSEILDQLNRNVTGTLRQSYEDSSVRDGMDLALIALDLKQMKLEFAGANNPVWIVRDSQLIEIKGNKFPIGIFIGEEMKKFTNNEFAIQKGDTIYVFSDGYEDQFGGEKGKKFMTKNLKNLLISISQKPMNEQKAILEETFESYRGFHEQVDDVCLIGVKI